MARFGTGATAAVVAMAWVLGAAGPSSAQAIQARDAAALADAVRSLPSGGTVALAGGNWTP